MKQELLKPQDLIVLLKLISIGDEKWTYESLSNQVGISSTETHASIKRSINAKLFNKSSGKPIRRALLDFLSHGVKYAFPAIFGPVIKGIPTAYAAPGLSKLIDGSNDDLPPVWPSSKGKTVRGRELSSLYHSVASAALKDPTLYKLLSLTDSIRIGGPRELDIARKELKREIYGDANIPN